MRGLNKVLLIGHVGMNPVVKELSSGDKLSTFPLATTEIWKVDGGTKEETTWHNIVCWKDIADSVLKSELKKSDAIYVEGKIKHRKFKNKENVECHVTEVVCDSFTIISRYKPKEVIVTG